MGRSKSTIWWLPWVTLEIKPISVSGLGRVHGWVACTGMYAQVVLSATASTTARAIAATTGTLTALPTPL